MSRSYKKPWYNDVGICKDIYWKTIRRKWKVETSSFIKEGFNAYGFESDFNYTHQKNIINDYDYSDYYFNIAECRLGTRK